MYNRWNLALLGLISALTIFSILVVWPGWPKRYLPDFIDYPEGPFIEINGREAMKLGLDLNGGTYVLLEADTSQLPPGTDLDDAMEGAKDVIERRINALGVAPTGATPAFYKGKGMNYPPEYGPLAAVTPGTPGGRAFPAIRSRRAAGGHAPGGRAAAGTCPKTASAGAPALYDPAHDLDPARHHRCRRPLGRGPRPGSAGPGCTL